MKGYKGMDENMRCRGMQYGVGNTYRAKPPIALCRNGLHFCQNLVDVFDFYDDNGKNRFFEVEAFGQTESDDKKTVAECLIVVRELEPKEVNRAKYGNGYGYGYGNGDGNIQRVFVFKD